MTVDDRDGASVRIPPPFVYLAAVIAGGLVDRYLFAIPLDLPGDVRFGAAALVTVIGVGVMAAAVGLFKRTGQDPKPWKSTPEIISTGVYRVTRNPMYMGMALLQAGIGLALVSAWIIALVPVVLAVVYVTAVRHEEAYLEEKFGAAYLSYKSLVRRWI
jgi:protein-S-isoprenylcysteine O-methyltransferase Ste14|tara:strand:+ start:417 stop:893 length:477 start_codon:yes stop_codon:yes gene_type:complete